MEDNFNDVNPADKKDEVNTTELKSQNDTSIQQVIPQNCEQQILPEPDVINAIPIKPLENEKIYIKKYYNWVGGTILLHLAITVALSLIFGIVFSFLFILSGNSVMDLMGSSTYTNGMLIIAAIVTGIANFTAALIGSSATKTKLKPMFNVSKSSVIIFLVGLILCFGIQSSFNYIGDFIDNLLQPFGINVLQALQTPNINGTITSIIYYTYVCMVAPITEELLFRAFALKNLSRFNVRFGIVASAMLFGLLHGNLVQSLFAFCIGLVLGYIAIKTDSIVIPIIIHVTINTFATISGFLPDTNIFNIIFIVWSVITILSAIAIIIYLIKKKKLGLPKSELATKKRGFPLFFTSPTCLISIIFYTIFIVITMFIS